ncbi:MAG: hypothetical protein A3G76_16785 [Acidobacteria bacterium RIFCSPLOWO2_12_FULL_65_11]|nr:MAG: hypothetical protein A3H95_12095 [Acidobacteria bacterium RIFCSPLOWO2_02_FULL_64_15]OFW34474.1 MAG: hypothetical protein A3G76_16785 [Acidobacteria bacterium RIFCSPLOWO2_12_FULL_65_11]
MASVDYFDYEPVAEQARIPPDKLASLREVLRAEFPHDDMLFELHVLRACMAVRDGLITLDELLPQVSPAPGA